MRTRLLGGRAAPEFNFGVFPVSQTIAHEFCILNHVRKLVAVLDDSHMMIFCHEPCFGNSQQRDSRKLSGMHFEKDPDAGKYQIFALTIVMLPRLKEKMEKCMIESGRA